MQVDLLDNFSKVVELKAMIDETKTSRVEGIQIQYDIVLKYWKWFKLQGHA